MFRSGQLRSILALTAAFAPMSILPSTASAQNSASTARPMNFIDVQHIRQIGSPTPGPDGKQLLYTLSTPDWKEAKRQTDIYLVSLDQGVRSTKRMTYTTDKNETAPRWSRDASFFVFASNRDAPASSAGSSSAAGSGGGRASDAQNQLYLMRADGGEARRITDAKDGVSTFDFTRDGRWLIFRAGKAGEEQLYRLFVAAIDSAKPEQITRQSAGVGTWKSSPDSRRIYFATADTLDPDEKLRTEKKFSVTIRNMETPLSSLWSLDLNPLKTTRLTRDTSIAVSDFTISDDSRWVGFRGESSARYKRNITEENLYSDLFLLEAATGRIERLTNNDEVSESGVSFSPDSRWIAFSAPNDLEKYGMSNRRLYLRKVDARGGQWRKLGESFDGDLAADFWSKDGTTIYFNEGIRATRQLMALDVAKNTVRQITSGKASTQVNRDDDTGALIITYADPRTPPTLFTVSSVDRLGARAQWRQLTDANPQARRFALGEEEEVTWKSSDGRMVGGILVKPVGFQAGRRYPLIVAIHGGPAGADVLGFNGGYGSQIYAGAGYAVLKPNYRGSTNYGEAHRTGIVGNYFEPGYNDIMTGVDHLIAAGIVDSTRMGVLGWSAGGHWSNWILTHTNRFKAISSGAGTSNWISMYAQSDVQRNRQYYLGNKLPYDDFDAYWNQSPIKYIRNARTPTMIHVVDGDPRVPRPQSEELHTALKRLGVPTELFVYPGQTHGITDPRNQLVKAMSEKAWMDYYVRGSGRRFAWRDVLETLEDESDRARAASVKKVAETK